MERVASEFCKGNVVLHRVCAYLTTLAELWKEYNCGWDNKIPPLRELESKCSSEWRNEKSGSTGKVKWCRRGETHFEIDRQLSLGA